MRTQPTQEPITVGSRQLPDDSIWTSISIWIAPECKSHTQTSIRSGTCAVSCSMGHAEREAVAKECIWLGFSGPRSAR